VVVTINDRGPFVHGRIIDLTPAAAHAIGFSGTVPVIIEVE
jgi:rare lipoprotein A